MIPLADRRRYFCLLGEGKFSSKKFEDIIVNVAYSLGYMNVKSTQSLLPAGTGIKQIAGTPYLSRSPSPYSPRLRSEQPEQQIEQRTQYEQKPERRAAACETVSQQSQKSLLKKAAPYILTSVGVIGLAASFIATQMAQQETWKTYSEDVERCSSSWVHIIGSALSVNTGRAGCLTRAEATRVASEAAISTVSNVGYAIFTGLVGYGLNIRQGGRLLENVPGIPGTLLKLANTSVQQNLVQQTGKGK